MNLAFRRDIDDDVGLKGRLAGQAPPFGKSLFLGIAGFDGGHAAQAVRPGGDAVLGEFAGSDINLAAAAHGPSATYRINVDTKLTCRGQNRRSNRDISLSARWGKHHFHLIIGGLIGCHGSFNFAFAHHIATKLQRLRATAAAGLATLAPTYTRHNRFAEFLNPATTFRIISIHHIRTHNTCLLYTSDAADEG